MVSKCNKILYSRVEGIIYIKLSEAYRTTSNEALCIFTGKTPIEIEVEEPAILH